MLSAGAHPAHENAQLIHSSTLLSAARANAGSGAANGKAYIFRGNAFTTAVTVTDIFDSSSRTWSSTPDTGSTGGRGITFLTDIVFGSGGLGAVYHTTSGTWSYTPLAAVGDGAGGALRIGSRAYFSTLSPRTVNVYDSRSGKWSTLRLPRGVILNRNSVALGNTLITAGLQLTFYDVTTGEVSVVPLPVSRTDPITASATVGQTALFFSSYFVYRYDAVTGQLTSSPVPAGLTLGSSEPAAVVGNKVVLFDALAGAKRHRRGQDVAVSYDAATGAWSQLPQGVRRADVAAVTVGTSAIFAGGDVSDVFAVDNVDIYTDASPAPVISVGSFDYLPKLGTVHLAFTNSGDAALPAGTLVNLYLTTHRGTLDASSELLGSFGFAGAFGPGATSAMSFGAPIAADLPPGSYYLVATIGTGKRHITPIAGTTEIFTIPSRGHVGMFAGGPGVL